MAANKHPHIAAALASMAVAIDTLCPDPANARKHGQKNLEAIKGSLHAFGQRKPIVVQREGMIVRAGNGTLAAAKALGWSHIAAVIIDDDNATAAQFALADNRSAELAEWDDDALVAVLSSMDADTQAMLGFDEADMRALLADSGELVQDEVPPVEEETTTKEGDLFILGRHRLLCGDSTSPEAVARLLDGAKPFLMVTDPPYGVEYDPSWRNSAGVSKTARTGLVKNDDRADWNEAWKLFPGVVAYVWHAGRFASVVAESLAVAGFDVRSQIIWAKSRFALSRGNYHWQHEPCLYAVRDSDGDLSKDQEKEILREVRAMLRGGFDEEHVPCWYAIRKGKSARWIGDRKQSTVWEIPVTDDGQKTTHGTQKPIECMGRPIRNHDSEDVYEPFTGSGTTLIACEQLGRRCFGMELSPNYCDVIVKRWENLTGHKAVRG